MALGTVLRSWPVFAAVLVGGCGSGRGKYIVVERHPDFITPELKRVAVIPFENASGVPGAAQRVSDKLEAALVNNRTYEVYTRQRLKMVLDEHDLARVGIVDSEVARRIGQLASVDALICGTCSRYGAVRQQVMVPKYVYTRGGGYYTQVPVTVHQAFVECNVVVIETVRGQHLAQVVVPASVRWAAGTPFPYPVPDLMQVAEMACAGETLGHIAVTNQSVRLRGDVLKTATGQYDGKWEWQKRITPSDERFFVVVTLPPEASRNMFRITIVPKDARDIVAEREFEWPEVPGSQPLWMQPVQIVAGWKTDTLYRPSQQGYEFEVASILERRGYGKYTAKLYSGAEPCAWYDFEILDRR